MNGGVALLVYALDEGVARRITDVHTSYSSCGPGYMSNKGATGLRFRVAGEDGGLGETFTCVLSPSSQAQRLIPLSGSSART